MASTDVNQMLYRVSCFKRKNAMKKLLSTERDKFVIVLSSNDCTEALKIIIEKFFHCVCYLLFNLPGF